MSTARATAASVQGDPTGSRLTASEFSAISVLVQNSCGINLTTDKLELVNSRLQKRLRALRLDAFAQYIEFVNSSAGADEFNEMISALTTNVTSFYRESHHFEHFAQTCLPRLVTKLNAGEAVRIWSAGCSNGAEAFTLAGVILERLPDAAKRNLRILATDIDPKSIERGKRGIYSEDFIQKLPGNYLSKWFSPSGNQYQVNDELRNLVSFNVLNLMEKWPLKKKYDVIFCRNVMIYFSRPTQEKLLQRFSDLMNPGSFLYIGHSERVGGPAASSLKPAGMTIYERH